jgi:hypothetical protein
VIVGLIAIGVVSILLLMAAALSGNNDAVVIGAIVSLLLGVIIIYAMLDNKLDKNKKPLLPQPKLGLSVIILFSIIIGTAVIFTYISVIVEYVPTNHFVEKFDGQDMSILIDREPTVLIPLKAAPPFPAESTTISASVYHNIDTRIQGLKLSTTDSILEYADMFKQDRITQIGNIRRTDYHIDATANHNLQVNNVTGAYTIDVLYPDKTTGMLQKWSVPFNWPIETMDMSIFSYFWIVLIGVIVSRLLSLVLDRVKKSSSQPAAPVPAAGAVVGAPVPAAGAVVGAPVPAAGAVVGAPVPAAGAAAPITPPVRLETADYIWITFSFIIAVLIFSSFSDQVNLTTSVLANISLAFAFGFGFDKVLEVAKGFQTLAS